MWVRVNRDDIRRMMGGYMVNNREKFVKNVEIKIVKETLLCGRNVCIDDTNLNSNTIAVWKNLAIDFKADIEFKEFKIGIDEAIARDKNREFPVGKKVILDFYKAYYPDVLKDYYTDKRIMNTTHYDSLPDVVLCDLDGTLAIHNGRDAFDHTKILTDKCDVRLKRLLNMLKCEVIFVSGRESNEDGRNNTRKWLDVNGFAGNKESN